MTFPASPSVLAFQQTWRGTKLSERSAYQQHFLGLCELLGLPKPAEVDPTGETYSFEKGVDKSTGRRGFADVWRRGVFAMEYKGSHANLTAAYNQLLQYSDALENPPVLITCDLDRFEIHTRFTNTPTQTYAFDLAGLSEPGTLDRLRWALSEPERLRPRTSTATVTEEAARRFGELARSLTGRGHAPEQVAHFLVQVLFCLFAEDSRLLPAGLFTRLLRLAAGRPEVFPGQIGELLAAMRDGGVVAYEPIERFNGGLFVHAEPLPLTGDELRGLLAASELDWGAIEPAIFGTLFERGLDPDQRSALGAHYTGRADIERVVEPVVMTPLRRRWAEVRTEADALLARWTGAKSGGAATTARNAFARRIQDFQAELAAVRVLDPACGSGNFLYVALSSLMSLEKEVITYAATSGLPVPFPTVGPHQVLGIEVNRYARELAQVVVWIGFLQWRITNGFTGRRDPVLDPLETIELRDALLERRADGTVVEAAWPAADFIVGNPPFLGPKDLKRELGDDYIRHLYRVFKGRVPGMANLCAYFLEKARSAIEEGEAVRAGLLSTTTIRVGKNREVLQRIKASGDIFMAWSNVVWSGADADVRIAMIGFDGGKETDRYLNGHRVNGISSALSAGVDVSSAHMLTGNRDIAFVGVVKGASFDISAEQAQQFLSAPLNVNGRPNSDVVRPWMIGKDITREARNEWIIDFGVDLSVAAASEYEAPFEYALRIVKPEKDEVKGGRESAFWWLHNRPIPGMRRALMPLRRFIATPATSKHRVFVWLPAGTLVANSVVAFARDDDYFFGVLHSRAHEVWSLDWARPQGVGGEPVYNVDGAFNRFALPWAPGTEPTGDPTHAAIGEAARALEDRRRAWLNPAGATEAELKKRTLTNLYNQRPAWLAMAHATLDRAVWDAYGWPGDEVPGEVPEETILERLFALNLERAAATAMRGAG